MKYIVTKAFQYKGTVYPGKVLDLSEDELRDPFIACHVAPLASPGGEAAKAETRTYFGNGTPRAASRETPAAAASDDTDGLTVGQLRTRLAKLGVHYSNRQSADELMALYRQAQEAVAGSEATPNRPIL